MMLAPLFLVYALASVVLMFLCLSKNSKAAMAALQVLWWLAAAGTGVLTLWAWQERAYSENWAYMGFLFVAAPVILLTVLMAVILLVLGRVKGVSAVRSSGASLFPLLGFLLLQGLLGLMAGRW